LCYSVLISTTLRHERPWLFVRALGGICWRETSTAISRSREHWSMAKRCPYDGVRWPLLSPRIEPVACSLCWWKRSNKHVSRIASSVVAEDVTLPFITVPRLKNVHRGVRRNCMFCSQLLVMIRKTLPPHSSICHAYSKSLRSLAAFLAANHFFSNPFDRSTPSHLQPGRIPYRFGSAAPI